MPSSPMLTLPLHDALRPLVADGRKTQWREVVDCDEPTRRMIEEMLTFEQPMADGVQAAILECYAKLTIGQTFRLEGVDADFICTGIRCERLQEISDEDALTEGVRKHCQGTGFYAPAPLWSTPFGTTDDYGTDWRLAFADMWSHIYPTGPKSWGSNPVVFVYEFERVEEGSGDE